MMTAETTFGVGDQVTIARTPQPILGGAPVIWTIDSIDVWPGTDIRVAVLAPADGSEYARRTVALSRLLPAEVDQ